MLSQISHDRLMEEMRKTIWGDNSLKKCPQWVHSSLMTYRESLKDALYREHLVWAFMGSDGVPRQLDQLSEADKQRVFNGEIQGRFYWLTTLKRHKTTENDGTIREETLKRVSTKFFH